MKQTKKRIIVGISGASGMPIAAEVLRGFRDEGTWEIYLVVTEHAKKTIELEYKEGIDHINALADVVCDSKDIAHNISSGTFVTEGMIVVPCSMKTLAGIANGFSENLLLRAADVTIKQRRKLVLVPRETPLSVIHLKNMLELARMDCVILPPVLTYYNAPQHISDMTVHIAGKILDEFNINMKGFTRWDDKQGHAPQP